MMRKSKNLCETELNDMKIIDFWDKELSINDNQRMIADKISERLMTSFRSLQKTQNCEIDNIEIETVNRCNNDCSFCPVNIHSDKRKRAVMSTELFYKIINDLADMNYRGIISLYSNNEPLLDERIYEFVEYVRWKLPEVKQELYTNGILLNSKKLDRLSKSVDKLIIDIYCDKDELPKNMLWLNEYPDKDNITAIIRNKNQTLTSRAGNSPNKACAGKYESFCIYPFRQLVIRPDGKVSRCCHDAYGETTLGDLNNQSVLEIWNGELYKNFRKTMIDKGRNAIKGCQKCDTLIYDCHLTNNDKYELKSELIRIIEQRRNDGRKIYVSGSDDRTRSLLIELQKNNIEYISLNSDTRNMFLDDSNAFLLLNYYTPEIINEIIAAGKKYVDDFVVYYRCF